MSSEEKKLDAEGHSSCIITLNFRGTKVQFHRKFLSKFPKDSPFSKYLKHTYQLDILDLADMKQEQDILINRNVYMFNNVLDYFETGELHFSHCLCQDVIQKEMKFWGIANCELGGCCLDRLLMEKDDHEHKHNIGKEWNKMNQVDQLTHLHTSSFHDMTPVTIKSNTEDKSKTTQRSLGPHKVRKCAKLYYILNNPSSSILAKVRLFSFILFFSC